MELLSKLKLISADDSIIMYYINYAIYYRRALLIINNVYETLVNCSILCYTLAYYVTSALKFRIFDKKRNFSALVALAGYSG